MNYEKLYFAFIEKYRNQHFEQGEYTESHHIVPRHAGGDDSKDNLIVLSYRQHCFAHRLLWKAYKKASDYKAWILMSGQEVDKVIATHKALGKRNVETGHLARIRKLANTPSRQKKLAELNHHKVETGLLDEYRLLSNAAWRGCSHTEEFKERKSLQMKKWATENQEHYASMIEKSVALKKENSKSLSEEVIKNAQRNEEYLHKTSSKSLNLFVSPEGLEFQSPIYAAKYYSEDLDYCVVENWCKRAQHGWSRKPKP